MDVGGEHRSKDRWRDPMGENQQELLSLGFDALVRLDFVGSGIAPDARSLAHRDCSRWTRFYIGPRGPEIHEFEMVRARGCRRRGPRRMTVSTLKSAFLTCVAAMLLPLMVQAQQAPALDRKDPVAVAQAYVKACQAGDVETAVSLLGPDEALRAAVRKAAGRMAGPPGITFDQMLLELSFMPLPMAREANQVDAKVTNDLAVVGFRVTSGFDQKIVLARQPDGTWAVQLLDSVRATTKSKTSVLEMMMGGPGGQPTSPGGSTGGLWKLSRAMREYATDHDGKLPPAEWWMDEIDLYVLDRQAFRSPAAPDKPYGYAMYAPAGGARNSGAREERVLVLVEAPGDVRNSVVTKEDLPKLKSVRPDGSIAYALGNGEVLTLPKGVSWETVLAPPNLRPEQAELASACEQNLQGLVAAARRYARKHGGLLPKAESWEGELQPYLAPGGQTGPGPFTCPAVPEIKHAYAINAELAGKNALDLADQDTLVLFFESDLNVPNAAGSPERDAADPPRHTSQPGGKRCNYVGYLGGFVGDISPPQKAPGQ
jgi:hypothetical protein